MARENLRIGLVFDPVGKMRWLRYITKEIQESDYATIVLAIREKEIPTEAVGTDARGPRLIGNTLSIHYYCKIEERRFPYGINANNAKSGRLASDYVKK